ncbi:L-lactate permease [Leucobacter sp. GX24907]
MGALDLLLAGVPIVLLIGLLALRVRALPAALIAIASVFVLGFRFPIAGDELLGVAHSMTAAVVNIVFVMLGGIVLSAFFSVSGAQDTISGWLAGAAHGRERAALLFALAVIPIIESIIGWGVGVIIVVPLLMRIGLNATQAGAAALLGLVLYPWGALGPGLLLAAEVADLDLHGLGVATAILTLPVLLVMGSAIYLVCVGPVMRGRLIGELAITVLVMWGVLWASNAWISPALAGIFSGVAGAVTLLGLARWEGGRPPRFTREVGLAFLPYALLIGVMLAVIGIAAIVDLGEWHSMVTSPGLWLTVTAAITPVVFRMARADVVAAAIQGVRVWAPVCFVTMLYVAFGALLAASGMTEALAVSSALLGGWFLVLMPLVGFVSGYVTGSNTAASAMVSYGIHEASATVGADPNIALGAQNVATGAAIMATPARIELVAGLAKQVSPGAVADTGRIIRTVLLANLVVVLILTGIMVPLMP